jgi:hypothetical protein
MKQKKIKKTPRKLDVDERTGEFLPPFQTLMGLPGNLESDASLRKVKVGGSGPGIFDMLKQIGKKPQEKKRIKKKKRKK